MLRETGYSHVPLDRTLRGQAEADSPEEAFAAQHEQPLVAAGELEETACRVRGVYACHLERSAGARVPERVRVVVHAARRLAVAKDIQSAWFTVWNLYVPRGRFVVTAVRSPVDVQRRDRRLQLCQLAFHRDADRLTATTALFRGGHVFEGEASGATGTADAFRLAALATVKAMGAALPTEMHFELVDLRIVAIAGRRVAVCALNGRGRLLYGVCEVRGAERDAAARAVLSAVNRLLPD